MCSLDSDTRFARCPVCSAVVKYKVGDTYVICLKCETKIKISTKEK